MTELTTVSFDLEAGLKEKAESLLNPLGMDLHSVIIFLLRQIVETQSLPLRPSVSINEQSRVLFERMRARAAEHGYMTDDEINAEIQAARAERRNRG